MTTNLLSVIEQLVGALEEWERVDVLGREPHIHRESWKQLVQDRNIKHTAAIAAGQQALEQTQVEAQSCANCKNNAWPFGSCDECGVQNDDPASGSNWEGVEQSPDCDICGSDCPLHPQATEPAPCADICQNCVGQGWEPSVYKGKVPCSFCQPAPSTAGEREVSLVEAFDNARKLVTPEILESFDALLQSTALPDHSEQHLDMAATPKIGCVQHDCAECQARAALPVGELTLEQITRIYDRYGGDMVNCTRAIERELAAARSQPTTEESSVVAGEKPVREPLSEDRIYEITGTQQRDAMMRTMAVNIARWVEQEHGITKKGEQ